jgi:transcription initiation factor IIE alpha subunit
MSSLSELCIDIENMFFVDHMNVEAIAEKTGFPVDVIKDYISAIYDDAIFDDESWRDEDDGQPTESEEWRDFDPDC